MYQIERFECGIREDVKERDPVGNCKEFVLLFDHNKRAFVGYDGDESDFMLHPETWLDKPIDAVISKGSAILARLKSREALESGSIIEYCDLLGAINRCFGFDAFVEA